VVKVEIDLDGSVLDVDTDNLGVSVIERNKLSPAALVPMQTPAQRNVRAHLITGVVIRALLLRNVAHNPPQNVEPANPIYLSFHR